MRYDDTFRRNELGQSQADEVCLPFRDDAVVVQLAIEQAVHMAQAEFITYNSGQQSAHHDQTENFVTNDCTSFSDRYQTPNIWAQHVRRVEDVEGLGRGYYE